MYLFIMITALRPAADVTRNLEERPTSVAFSQIYRGKRCVTTKTSPLARRDRQYSLQTHVTDGRNSYV